MRTFHFAHSGFLATVAMTQTQQILQSEFGQHTDWEPTLLFARETQVRRLDISNLSSAVDGNRLTVDASPAHAPMQVIASINWVPYHHQDGAWSPIPIQEYWQTLTTTYRDDLNAFDVGDDDPQRDAIRRGQAVLARSYYLSLYSGMSRAVQSGQQVLPATNTPPLNDSEVVKFINGPGRTVAGMVQDVAADTLQALRFVKRLNLEMSSGRQLAVALGEVAEGRRTELIRDLGAFAESGWKVAAGIGAGAVLVATLVSLEATGVISAERAVRIGVSSVSAALAVAGVVKAMQAVQEAREAYGGISAAMSSTSSAVTQASMEGNLIGAAIGAAVTWGIAIYTVVHGGMRFASLQFDAVMAGAIAATIALIILAVIAAIPVVGQIFMAVVAMVDGIITLVCAIMGKDPNSGVCAGITGWLAKGIEWLIFSENIMVTFTDPNRIRVDQFQQAPDAGPTGAGAWTLHTSLVVTDSLSLITWADTHYDLKAGAYWWQYSDDRLKSTTFHYVLDDQPDTNVPAERGQVAGQWQGSDDPFTLSVPVSNTMPLDQPGINRPLHQLILHEGYAVPVQECWAIPLVPFPPVLIPICYIRSLEGTNHLPLGSQMIYDVFPPTLDEFYDLAQVGPDAYRLGWDPLFPRLKDADGDGLRNRTDSGSDPDDARWDSDGDGLSDLYEILHGTDPNNADTDGDCVDDRVEQLWGTSPVSVDTDGDGLSDFVESRQAGRHCAERNEHAGWSITVVAPGAAPLTTWVTAPPLLANGDGDNWSDAEEQVYGFNPWVADGGTRLDFSAGVGEAGEPRTDRYVRPGQRLHYTATLTNDLADRWVQGDLESHFPHGVDAQIPPRDFVLYPQQRTDLQGDLTVSATQSSRTVFRQEARGLVTDWRANSDYADLWLPFEETAGANRFADRSGVQPAPYAQCGGSACPAADQPRHVGQAIHFDGADDYIEVPGSLAPSYSREVTLAMWVYVEGSGRQTLLDGGRGYGLAIMDNGHLLFYDPTGQYDSAQSSRGLSRNAWHHIAVIWRERNWYNSYVVFYIDGEEAGRGLTYGHTASCRSGDAICSVAGPSAVQANRTLNVGKATGQGGHYQGRLDELCIYRRSLNTQQIGELFDKAVFDQEGMRVDLDGRWHEYKAPYFADHRYRLDGGKFTMAVWLLPRSNNHDRGQTPRHILGGKPYFPTGYPFLGQRASSTADLHNLEVGFGDGHRAYRHIFDDALTLDTFNHVVVTYDSSGGGAGSGLYTLYVNGERQGSAEISGGPKPYGTDELWVALPNGNTLSSFNGVIMSPLIYTRVLNDEEIAGLYETSSATVILRLDDAAGSTVFKDETTRHAGNCSAGHCPTAGVLGREGNAAYFDGNDVISIAADVSETDFAMSFWFRTTCDGCGLATISGNATPPTGGRDRNVFLRNGNVCGLVFQGGKSDEILCSSGVNYADGQWHHVVHTLGESIGTHKLYVDGHLAAQGSYSTSGFSWQRYALAGFSDNANHPYFVGEIDDFQILHRSVDAADVGRLYNSVPILRLRFNEAQGATAFADDANGLQAVCTGAACPAAGEDGRIGAAARFHGSQSVTVGPNDALDLSSGQFTLMAWIQPQHSDDGYHGILGYQQDSPLQRAPSLWVHGRTRLYAQFQGRHGWSTADGFETHDVLQEGLWNHVALTFDGTTAAIYVNGELVRTTTDFAGTSPLNLKRFTVGAVDTFFNGKIDEVQIFAQGLNAAAIRRIYTLQQASLEENRRFDFVIDADAPVSSLPIQNAYLPLRSTILHLTARDATSGVSDVDFGVNGHWTPAPVCRDATAGGGWCPTFTPTAEGRYTLQTRATDVAGNVESPGPGAKVLVDGTPPVGTAEFQPGARLTLAQDGGHRWSLSLSGRVTDPTIGDAPGSGVAQLMISLLDSEGNVVGSGPYAATLDGETWQLAYPIDDAHVVGSFTLHASARDHVGNQRDVDLVTFALDQKPPALTLTWPPVTASGEPAASTGPIAGYAITRTDAALAGSADDSAAGPGVDSGVQSVAVALVPDAVGDPTVDLPPPAGQVLHLPLEDTPDQHGGLHFRDVSQNRHAGDCLGRCPLTDVDGRVRKAVQLDAGGDGQSGGIDVTLPLSSADSSLALWVRGSADGGLLQTLRADGSLERRLWIENGNLCAELAAETICSSGLNLNDGGWHALLYTVDGTGQRLTVDGAQVAAGSATASGALARLQIGRAGDAPAYAGRLDEVRVFERALDGSELQAIQAQEDATLVDTMPHWQPVQLSAPGAAQTDWNGADLLDGLEGHYRLDLRATDVAGNSHTQTGVWSGQIDTRAPRATFEVLPLGSGQYRYIFSAEDANLTTDGFNSPCGSGVVTQQTNFTAPWFLALAGYGHSRLFRAVASCVSDVAPDQAIAQACDQAGHCAVLNAPQNLATDAPVVDVESPGPNAVQTSLDPINLRGHAAAPGRVQQIELLIDGVSVDTLTFPDEEASREVTWTSTWTPPAEGRFDLAARVTSWDGQTAENPIPHTLLVDITPPTVSVHSPVTTAHKTSAGVIELSGDAIDLTGIQTVTVEIQGETLAATMLENGRWVAAWSVGSDPLPDGAVYTVAATATDPAGNQAGASASVEIDVVTEGAQARVQPHAESATVAASPAPQDGAAPAGTAAPVRLAQDHTPRVGLQMGQGLKGVLPVGQAIIHGFSYAPAGVPAIEVEIATGQGSRLVHCTDETPHDGYWRCSVDVGADGTSGTLRARGLLADGQSGPWSDDFPFQVDGTPPSLTAQVLQDPVRDLLRIGGNAQDNVRVDHLQICLLGRCVKQGVSGPSAGQSVHSFGWSYERGLSGEDGEELGITVTAVDRVGNRSAPLDLLVYADNRPPLISVEQRAHEVELLSAEQHLVFSVTASDSDRVAHVLSTQEMPHGHVRDGVVATYDGDDRWSIFLAPHRVGPHTFWIQAVDRHGNVRTVGPYQVTVLDMERAPVPDAPDYLYLPLISKP